MLVDRSHPIYNQQFIQPQPSRVYNNQRQWTPMQDNLYDNRRHSMIAATSEMCLNPRRLTHIDRRPSIPFSPPHQPYDTSRMVMGSNEYSEYKNLYHHPYPISLHHRNNMIPSPPPQSSLFKPEIRRLSFDESLAHNGLANNNLARRQSADPHFYHQTQQHYRRGSRRMSLQPHSPPTRPPPQSNLSNGEMIQLPPLRSIVSDTTMLQPDHHHPSKRHYSQEGSGEVDAAVAMMQLSSRRQTEAKVNY